MSPLWHVEQWFRMSETDLRARPIFHHTRDAIEAHLTIAINGTQHTFLPEIEPENRDLVDRIAGPEPGTDMDVDLSRMQDEAAPGTVVAGRRLCGSG